MSLCISMCHREERWLEDRVKCSANDGCGEAGQGRSGLEWDETGMCVCEYEGRI